MHIDLVCTEIWCALNSIFFVHVDLVVIPIARMGSLMVSEERHVATAKEVMPRHLSSLNHFHPSILLTTSLICLTRKFSPQNGYAVMCMWKNLPPSPLFLFCPPPHVVVPY